MDLLVFSLGALTGIVVTALLTLTLGARWLGKLAKEAFKDF